MFNALTNVILILILQCYWSKIDEIISLSVQSTTEIIIFKIYQRLVENTPISLCFTFLSFFKEMLVTWMKYDELCKLILCMYRGD